MLFRFAQSVLYNRRSIRNVLISLFAVIFIILMAYTAEAWRIKTSKPAVVGTHTAVMTTSMAQPNSLTRSHLNGRLRLQPEADKLRRRLGQRFMVRGRELSVLVGTLLVGGERYTVRITRSQDDDDERLAIALSGRQEAITWNGLDGAKSNGNLATGNLRAIVERLALDSPDQFILSQLRGASYFTAARAVRPTEAGGSDNYIGPVWDLVRVAEPTTDSESKSLSKWRLYYINTVSGLIDKVLSQEHGESTLAELSGWVRQGSELAPTRIAWSRNGQVIMEMNIINIAYSSKP